jgi:hypothetical protein
VLHLILIALVLPMISLAIACQAESTPAEPLSSADEKKFEEEMRKNAQKEGPHQPKNK